MDDAAYRTVHLHVIKDGDLIIGQTSDETKASLQVVGVPKAVSNSQVRLQFTRLAIWPWPMEPIQWAQVADLPAGSIVRDLRRPGRPKSENPITGAERAARHRKAVGERGGRQLSAIQLAPEDAQKLAAIKESRGIAQDAEMIRRLIREA